jgi:hypothetical protein
MTHGDGLPRFSARRVGCGDDRVNDAQAHRHRKGRATLSESLGGRPSGSRRRPVGVRRKALTMPPSLAASLLPDGPPTQSPWVIINAPWYQIPPSVNFVIRATARREKKGEGPKPLPLR